MRDDDLRLADLLAALSVTTDLGMGQEPEKAVRGCLVATGLARAMDLPEAEVRDVFWTTLLQHVGCTAPAHETSYLFGDDLTVAVQAERTDSASLRETLALLATVGRGTGVDRPRHLARMIAAGKDGSRGIARAVCEVGDLMAERLALGAGVRLGLRHSMEALGREGRRLPAGRRRHRPAGTGQRGRDPGSDLRPARWPRRRRRDGPTTRRRMVRPGRGRPVRPRRGRRAGPPGRGGRVGRGAGGRAPAGAPDPPGAARRRGPGLRRHGRPAHPVHPRPLGRRGPTRRGGRRAAGGPRRRRRPAPPGGPAARPGAGGGLGQRLGEARAADRHPVGAGPAASLPHRADPLPVHGPRAPGPGRRDAPRAPGRLRLPPRRLRGPAPHPGPAPGRRRRLPGHDPGPPLPRPWPRTRRPGSWRPRPGPAATTPSAPGPSSRRPASAPPAPGAPGRRACPTGR